jgi:2,3-bisphosphoglycerate-independent phosphoglycerate mutase
MVNPHTGNPDTEHTTNPVPFVLFNNRQSDKNLGLKSGGSLASVAPTILDFMGIANPNPGSSESLLIRSAGE